MNHLGTVEIESERLLLRRFTKADISAVYRNWASDKKATEFLRWSTHTDIAVTKKVVKGWLKNYSKDDFYQWAIVLKDVGEPIGIISVVDMNERIDMVSIGYCIGSKWWHQGITSEAFSLIIPFLFNKVRVNRIEAQHDPNNPNSGRVMQKCGLKYEGTLRQGDWSNKGIIDACIYSLLAEDFINT